MSGAEHESQQIHRLIQAVSAKLLADQALIAKAKGPITIKAYQRGAGFDVQLNVTT